MQIVQETSRLHRLTRFGMINCFLVTEDDGSGTLIDTGLPGSGPAILATARQLGTPIRRVLLTHAHIDHVGSLDAVCDQLHDVRVLIGADEAPLFAGDFSSYGLESGQKPFGFTKTRTKPSKVLADGELVGSLQTIFSAGHTPGHVAYFDPRDGSVIAGDAFTTQMGIVVAGVFEFYFPFPAWFSWNLPAAAASARKLCALGPTRLSVGHGRTIESPLDAMERATNVATQQAGRATP
jgi:glyoxylase-like metal-dependent hydrolase (beta-lactamase superfamily II)